MKGTCENRNIVNRFLVPHPCPYLVLRSLTLRTLPGCLARSAITAVMNRHELENDAPAQVFLQHCIEFFIRTIDRVRFASYCGGLRTLVSDCFRCSRSFELCFWTELSRSSVRAASTANEATATISQFCKHRVFAVPVRLGRITRRLWMHFGR